MPDIQKEKYSKLMTEIENLEDQIDILEKENSSDVNKLKELKNKMR